MSKKSEFLEQVERLRALRGQASPKRGDASVPNRVPGWARGQCRPERVVVRALPVVVSRPTENAALNRVYRQEVRNVRS